MNIDQLQNIYESSQDITNLNAKRLKDWSVTHSHKNAKPALLMYNGAIFKQMSQRDYSTTEQAYAQDSVRIISALYGFLRPYDLIQPYRLEMRTTLDYTNGQSLALYWQDMVTQDLKTDCKENDVDHIINLASNEYSRSISQDQLDTPVISVDFKEEKNGKLRTIAIYAKQARGAMMEYAIKSQAQTLDDLKNFTNLDYQFQSQEDDTLLFTRKST